MAGEVKPTAEEDLVAALGALVDPPREGKVAAGARQYKFMTLPDLLQAVRPVFAAHNLAVLQLVETTDTGVGVVTRILHASGWVFESPALVLRCNPDPQSVGSATTYGRRYQLAALVGLAGDDDDGQAAQNPRGNTPEVFNQTRPVQRAKKVADDPQDAPYQLPVTQPPPWQPPPPTTPVPGPPDLTSPAASSAATPRQTKHMWTLLTKTGWGEGSNPGMGAGLVGFGDHRLAHRGLVGVAGVGPDPPFATPSVRPRRGPAARVRPRPWAVTG